MPVRRRAWRGSNDARSIATWTLLGALALGLGACDCGGESDCEGERCLDAGADAASPVCGDGVVAGDEVCDDGNTRSGDRCPFDCSANTCGDGVRQPGEVCFDEKGLITLPGKDPAVLVAADIDGDGDLDLAVSYLAEFSVTLLVNSGGRFEIEASLPLVSAGITTVAGDFNGDGLVDLAVGQAGFDDGVAVFINLGGFEFSEPARVAVGKTSDHLAAGDLDGDGDLDLAVTSPPGLHILTNDGAGRFESTHEIALGDDLWQVAAGDLNGDPHVDLLALDRIDAAFVLLGDGAGGFTNLPTLPLDRPDSVALGDFDDDGDIDALVGSRIAAGLGLTRLENDGSGGLAKSGEVASGRAPHAADLDGDGDTDAVAVNSPGLMLVENLDGDPGLIARFDAAAGVKTEAVVAGDWDGDGDVDVAAIGRDGSLSVLDNDGGAYFNGRSYPVGREPRRVGLADLDGDGNLDVYAIAAADSAIVTLAGDGRGDLAAPATFDTVTDPRDVTAALLDDDALPDLIAVGGDRVAVHLGQAGGGFAAPAFTTAGVDNAGVAAGDFDGDGDVDLLVVEDDTAVARLLVGDGTGALAPSPELPLAARPIRAAPGDLDGDGDLDAVVGHLDQGSGLAALTVLANDGGGLFEATVIKFEFTETIFTVELDDVDGDGDLDIVAGGFNGGVLLNDGQGRFSDRVATTIGVAIAADLDGDGASELLTANGDSDRVVISVPDGDGWVGRARFALGSGPNALAAGDLDGDGAVDIVSTVGQSNVINVLLAAP